MQLSQAAISLILGIIILIAPKFLNYIIAFWLIFQGLVGLGIVRF